jgi:hypoxanthine phosphoribosyltransferase
MELCRRLVTLMREDGFQPDLIVAIGRGGYVPGRILADLLGIMDLVGMRVEHYRGIRKGPAARIRQGLDVPLNRRRVLVVDDVSDTGETFEAVISHLSGRGACEALKTATLHHKVVSRFRPDYFAHRITRWRWIIYPWAVTEDLTALAGRLSPPPRDASELGRRLREKHGIEVSATTLVAIMERLPRPPPESGRPA